MISKRLRAVKLLRFVMFILDITSANTLEPILIETALDTRSLLLASKISLMRVAVTSTEPKSNLEKSRSVFPSKVFMCASLFKGATVVAIAVNAATASVFVAADVISTFVTEAVTSIFLSPVAIRVPMLSPWPVFSSPRLGIPETVTI